MIIQKVITGFVVQKFDTETRKFISQEFIGSDDRDWELENGTAMLNLNDDKDAALVFGLGGVDEPYLNMEMIQPTPAEQPNTPLLAQATSFEVGEKVLVVPSDNPNDLVRNEFIGTVVRIRDGNLVEVVDADGDSWDCDPVQVHHIK